MAEESFVLDMTNFVKKAKGNMDLVVRKVVLDIGTRIVMRSPVGDPSKWEGPAPKGYTGGRFRANWQYGENVAPNGTLDARDPAGTATVVKLSGAVKPDAAGKLHYLTNNLPYAMPLERGWSQQAPAGMVGITIREFANVVNKAAAAARSL